MSRIAFVPLQELGHILPTFHLAKGLRRNGHDVVYVGLEDCRAVVEAEGFEYVAICKDGLPAGSLARHREQARGARGRVRAQAIEHTWLALAGRSLVAGREDGRLASVRADLFLVDRVWEDPMLVLTALGARVQLYTIILWAHPRLSSALLYDRDVPPPSTLHQPAGLQPVRRRVEWSGHNAREGVSWAVREREHFRLTADAKRAGFAQSALTIAALGRRRNVMKRRFVRRPGALRTLVLCPEELDFPREGPHPCAEYGGPSINLSRREPDLELGGDPRPLVYCAVGSQGHRVGPGGGFLRTVIDAARTNGWRMLMSVGDAATPAALGPLGPLPEGVTIVARAPQLKVLERAAVAIVHGGLGTIKECIWFGVPMLVLPGAHDQPGNAARVEYHGLGYARARQRTTAPEIARLVDDLVREPSRRQKLAQWSSRFRELERQERHLQLIEAAL